MNKFTFPSDASRSNWSARLVVVLAIAAVTFVAGCEEANQYIAPPPPEVSVAQPVTQDVVDFIEFTGTTQSTAAVDIRARVNGYLQSIHFEDGADVQKGQLLFVIEAAPFEADLAAAQASLQKAQAALRLAQTEIARITPLVQQRAVSQQELDTSVAQRETAAAEVASAQAAIAQAQLNLNYTRVEAPMSGRISRHMVDVGNLVQAQTTLLTTIESYEPIHAYFSVSESDVLRFMERRRAAGGTAGDDAPVLYLGLSNEEGYPHEGRLDFAELGVDINSGTAQRRGIFPNQDRALVPGLFVRIRAPLGDPKPRLLVTERAIGADQRGEYLLVVNEKNVVEYRPVKLGISVEGLRVVEQGVQPGEWVVVNGLQRARPNSTVNPQRTEQMAGNGLGRARIIASTVGETSEPLAASDVAKVGG